MGSVLIAPSDIRCSFVNLDIAIREAGKDKM